MTYFNNLGQARVGWRIPTSGGGGGVDADALAFITAAAITDATQQSAIITLVTQLKTYGIWSKMKALYPFVGGTAEQHRFNLKDPRTVNAAFYLDFFGGGTHSANGYLPNGNSYADTKLGANLLQTNNHFSYYSRTSTVNVEVELGVFNNLPLAIVCQLRAGSNYLSGGLASVVSYTTTSSALGFWTGTKTSDTSRKGYLNGVLQATSTSPDNEVLPSLNIFLGARNNGGIGGQLFSTKQSAFASIGDGLTDTEAANFYTAVQTYQTTLGRQVGVPIVADTDAQAFLNAAVITATTQATAINTLVTDLKAANIWTKMKALYPFVGGTAAQHRFNLKDPRMVNAAFYLDFIGGGTHSATGYLPNGTTAYANTKLTPSTSLLQDSTHISYYSRTNTAGSGIDFGVYQTNPQANLYAAIKFTDGKSYFRVNRNAGGGTESSLLMTSASVFFMVNREASYIGESLFINNTKTSFGRVSTGLSTNPIPFGAFSNDGVYAGFSNKETAFVSIGDGLTDTEATAFYNAVQAYQTTLSRAV